MAHQPQQSNKQASASKVMRPAWQSKRVLEPRPNVVNIEQFVDRLVANHGKELAELADR